MANIRPFAFDVRHQPASDFQAFWETTRIHHLVLTDSPRTDHGPDGPQELLERFYSPELRESTLNRDRNAQGHGLEAFLLRHSETLEKVSLNGVYGKQRATLLALLECERLSTLRVYFFDVADIEYAGLFPHLVGTEWITITDKGQRDMYGDCKELKTGPHATIIDGYAQITQPALDRVLRYRLSRLEP